MRLGILGDIRHLPLGRNPRGSLLRRSAVQHSAHVTPTGTYPSSDRMCIDFAAHLTATLSVEAFLQVGDMCHYRWTLERFPSRSLA
jgi:hypothetical protein